MRAKIQKISKYRPSIFQGKLAFNSARGGISLTTEHYLEPFLLRALLGSLVLLAAAYIYLVGATILNVIARKEALSQSASLTSTVAELEHSYFTSVQGLSPDDGTSLGLSPVSGTSYVRRPGGATALLGERNEL